MGLSVTGNQNRMHHCQVNLSNRARSIEGYSRRNCPFPVDPLEPFPNISHRTQSSLVPFSKIKPRRRSPPCRFSTTSATTAGKRTMCFTRCARLLMTSCALSVDRRTTSDLCPFHRLRSPGNRVRISRAVHRVVWEEDVAADRAN